MKKRNKVFRLITLAISVTLLVSLFGTVGTASADEDDDTVYYDEFGEKLKDPCNADECYSENSSGNLTLVECPKCTEKNDDSGEKKSIPPGQLVRNGLSGYVVAVNVTGDYFLVKTNFGIVQVSTNQTVNTTMIGQRVAVKLEKVNGGASKYAQNGTDNRTGNVTGITANGTVMQFSNLYRIANALHFRLIPSKSEKQHKWGTVESLGQGCVFVDEDGNQIPVKCGKSSGNIIGLISGYGNGKSGNATVFLLQTQQMNKILERIKLRIKQAEDEGDGVTVLRLEWQLEKFEEKQLRLEEKRTERAATRAEKAKNKD